MVSTTTCAQWTGRPQIAKFDDRLLAICVGQAACRSAGQRFVTRHAFRLRIDGDGYADRERDDFDNISIAASQSPTPETSAWPYQ
jgi:hypothetical protein